MGREGASCFPLARPGVGRDQEQSPSLDPLGDHAPYFEGLSQNGVEKGRGAPLAQAGQLVPVSQPPQPSACDRVCLPLCSGSGPDFVCQTLMFIMFQSKYLPLEV